MKKKPCRGWRCEIPRAVENCSFPLAAVVSAEKATLLIKVTVSPGKLWVHRSLDSKKLLLEIHNSSSTDTSSSFAACRPFCLHYTSKFGELGQKKPFARPFFALSKEFWEAAKRREISEYMFLD